MLVETILPSVRAISIAPVAVQYNELVINPFGTIRFLTADGFRNLSV